MPNAIEPGTRMPATRATSVRPARQPERVPARGEPDRTWSGAYERRRASGDGQAWPRPPRFGWQPADVAAAYRAVAAGPVPPAVIDLYA